MPIVIIHRKQKINLDAAEIRVDDALTRLGFPPESYLVIRDGEMLSHDDLLYDGDEIKLIAVIMGG